MINKLGIKNEKVINLIGLIKEKQSRGAEVSLKEMQIVNNTRVGGWVYKVET